MINDAAHHDEREREQRQLAGGAGNITTRDFHNDTADRHADKASSIREASAVTAREISRRLVHEATEEAIRIVDSMADREARHPLASYGLYHPKQETP